MADELLTDGERESFLDSLRQGITQGLAARAVGLTGTKMRACRRRDPVFAAECVQAESEGEEFYRERLSAAARLRALAADDSWSPRILEVELATHIPEKYAHLRRDRLTVDGRIQHGIVIDPAVLETMPLDRLLMFREFLREIGGGQVQDGEYVEIPDEVISPQLESGDG